MKKKKINLNRDIIIFIITVILVACFFIWRFYEHNANKNKIESNYAYTFGIIVENMLEANNSWGIKVKYEANGVCYVRNYDATFWCQNNDCLNDTIKVEYSAKDPNISRIVKAEGEIIYPTTKLGSQNYQINCDTIFE